MAYRCTFDSRIYVNPSDKFCIIRVKTKDTTIPQEAQSKNWYRDRQIRFTAVGYDLPLTDAVEMELEGEWVKGKYGMQLQVEAWQEIVPPTMEGLRTYLCSGLIKGIGPITAAEIVAKFGLDALKVLEETPERYLEIRGITQPKLDEIQESYAQNRILQNIITLLAPFKLTAKTAMRIYQELGPNSVEILKKSPFELCQISGFGFRRVDTIVQKTNSDLHDPMRIKGAVLCVLDEARSNSGHLFLEREALIVQTHKMLNEKLPLKQLHVTKSEIDETLNDLILDGVVVSADRKFYLPKGICPGDGCGPADRRAARGETSTGNGGACIGTCKSGIGNQAVCQTGACRQGSLPAQSFCDHRLSRYRQGNGAEDHSGGI